MPSPRRKEDQKKESGRFINRYDLHYTMEDGSEKIYEMISRNPDLKTFEELTNDHDDAVSLIMHDESGEKILLNREFRMAVGRWVYNFPAGLIDEGETPEQAARRELKEETFCQSVSGGGCATAPSGFQMKETPVVSAVQGALLPGAHQYRKRYSQGGTQRKR